jgi:serine/threonine protein kinase
LIGRVVGKYKLLEQIGEGGMGTVYRAEHIVLGSPAAVKILLPQLSRDVGVLDRFFQEARTASAIRHPGIVEVFDYGRLAGDQAYIAMELLRGESLAGLVARRGRLDAALATQIAGQALVALNATHVVGVIHRDLKPDNIFLVRDVSAPGAIRVKILDFGIAKLIGDPQGRPHGARAMSEAGAILGTPAYMAPEQCLGGIELDARVDVYAIGCLLFEMLTGRPPFVAAGDREVMAMHLHEPPPRLANLVRDLPVELDALLAKLLTKERDDRIPSAAYALATLERAPVEPLVGEVELWGTRQAMALVGLGEPPAPPARWLPIAVISGAVAIALVIAAAIGLT